MSNCVIKDTYTNQYFTASVTPHGWYHPDIGRARIYTKMRYALKTIRDGGHHVAWPGNRSLDVVLVKIKEIKS